MLYGNIGTNITRQECKLFYPLKNKFRRTSLGNTITKDMKKQWWQKEQVLTAKTLTHKHIIYMIRFQYINKESSKQQTSTVNYNIPF